MAADALCRAVADKDGGKHIHLHIAQLCQSINMGFFAVASDVADRAADLVGGKCFQQDITGLLQIVSALSAGGVVEDNGGSGEPPDGPLRSGQP